MGAVNEETIFSPAKSVVVRPQRGEYLFYNSLTDELHLVPLAGYAVYSRCDGTRTINKIADELLPQFENKRDDLRHQLQEFLDALEKRGLVERVDG